MTTAQRVIKYLAIALAIFIIVSIVSAVLFGINQFSNVLGLTKGRDAEQTMKESESSEKIMSRYENSQIDSLKIELDYSSLTIKEGDSFAVESNTRNIEHKQTNGQLVIRENNSGWFIRKNINRVVIVTIPRNTILANVKIETGAGEIKIENLSTKKLSLDMGAGKVTIQNLEVTERAKIEGGAGKVEILSGEIANLDLNMGVGSFRIVSSLFGNNKIDAGIGKLELELSNGLDNYTIRASKGIGSIKIKDKEISDNVEYGTGENNIKIDGGVGSITIN